MFIFKSQQNQGGAFNLNIYLTTLQAGPSWPYERNFYNTHSLSLLSYPDNLHFH